MPKHAPRKTIAKPQKDTSARPFIIIGVLCGAVAVMLTWAGVSLVRSARSPSVEPIFVAGDAIPEWDTLPQESTYERDSFSALDLIQNAPHSTSGAPKNEEGDDEENEEDNFAPAQYPPDSWTARYAEEMGVELTRAAIRDSLKYQPELVKRFIEHHAADTVLPEIPEGVLTITEERGKDAIARYLQQISVNHNRDLHPVEKSSIVSGFSRATQPLPSFTELEAILLTLSSNIETLEAIPVPQEALQLHRTYLSATMALFLYTKDLRTYHDDPVGALMAAVRIDKLQDVYNEAADLIAELENRYTIN